MITQNPILSTFSFSSVVQFRQNWIRWAFGFFFLAVCLGLVMRSFHVVEIPYFEYRNILHTHSHLALLGWGHLMLLGGIVFGLVKEKDQVKDYKWLFLGTILSLLGMLFSFPFQGYGVISISFSTLHVLLSYGFAYKLLKVIRSIEKTPATRLIRLAIWFMVISTFGLWSLGPISATLGRMHELYFMTIQWFLHFQLNGWFVLGVLGLILLFFEEKGFKITWTAYQEWILSISVILTFMLAVTWAEPRPIFFQINGLAVIIQLIAYSWILKSVFILLNSNQLKGFAQLLLILALASLVAKAILQGLLVFPSIAVISYSIRMYVIGFLHLVLLGAMTMGVSAVAIARGWISEQPISRLGWILMISGFVITEFLLFLQGTLIWLKMGFLPEYNFWLFLASCLFPLSLAFLFAGLRSNEFSNQSISNSKTRLQKRINPETMRKTMIWSMGVLGILLTSCGGGSGESSNSTATEIAPKEEVKADPKGIGEFKTVEIGEGIDETLAASGKAIVDMKCTACHQLNDKRLVGPGFQGVTNRRRPEWIMNMITNVDVMLDQDPAAQKLLEECLTRMPNQNITLDDARGILEFMRKNDEEKAGQRDAATK
ncbi:cytochrome c [Algoriphagus boseongensis]|uniref:Cytochrome c n=1 Tax=Algoriphagus boseongensis TaxID=1442587 RepID=A0A4R6T6I0_9BACT|nr:c-type cytochrome [Algoriphagus boseongensis]TDQ16558.1 cytochrome c [Algoriphagus boseongensis]